MCIFVIQFKRKNAKTRQILHIMDDDYEHINKSIIYVNSHYLLTKTFFMKKLFTIMLFAAMLLPWAAQAQISPATLPYTHGFEDTTENANWTIVNATSVNKFVISTALNNGGTYSLYVSNSTASPYANSYNSSNPCYTMAYREFTVATAGVFTFDFDWKCEGEGGYDYGRVAIAPGSTVLSNSTSSSYSGFDVDAVPTGWIAIDGGEELSEGPSTWQNVRGDEMFLAAGTYKFVVYWENDGSIGYNPPLAIDNVAINVVPCPRPTGINLTWTSDVEATLSWNANENRTFKYWFDTVDAPMQYNATATAVNDTTITLSGLEPNTYYDFYLQGLCGTDTTIWVSYRFRTNCSAYPESVLPLNEGFEQWLTNEIDPCYSKGHNGTSVTTNYPTVVTSQYHIGYKSLYLYSTASYASWLILPKFETAINGLQISFWMKKTSTTDSPVIIGVVPGNDASQIDTIAVVRCESANTWEQITVPLSIYQGTMDGRLALISPNGVSSQNYIDDLTVELLPECPRPMELSAAGTSSETAIVRWLSTGASGFQVEYDTVGFTLGTGTREVVYADSLEILSLSANTAYEAYVRSYCDSDSSNWFGPISFRTTCGALSDNNLPYFESFTSWRSLTDRDFCYTLNNNNTTTVNYPSFSSGYSKDSTNSLDMYSGSGYASWACLPAFETSINSLQVVFSMYKTSTSEYPLMVGVMTNPNDLSTFDTITTVSCVSASTWQDFVVPFTLYQGEGQYIAFVSPDGVASGNYIDSIVVNYADDCSAPINVSGNIIDYETAVVYHTNTSSGSIMIEYDVAGFELGQGVQIIGGTDSTVINGLNPATSYEVYVYASCDGGSQSAVVGPLYFRTGCSPDGTIDVTSTAYTETFDDYYTGVGSSYSAPSGYPNHTVPTCWSLLNLSQSSNTYPQAFISAYSTYAESGSQCLFFKSSNTTPVYAILPQFTSDIEDLRIRFVYRNEGTGTYNGTLSIGVMTDPTVDSTFIALETYPQTISKTHVEHIFSFDTITGTDYYIAFRYTGGSSNNYYLSIDDVKVDLAPQCLKPQNLVAFDSTMTETTAELYWEEVGTATSWIIEYGLEGFELGQGTTIEVNTNPYVLTGLDHSTRYDFYVRSICSSGDTSEYSLEPYAFRTSCGVVTSLPWSADLDGAWYYYGGTERFPSCWALADGGTSGYNFRNTTTTSNIHSGNVAIYFYGSSTSTTIHNDWLVTPEMQLTGAEQLTFWMKASSASYRSNLSIYAYTVDPADTVLSVDNFVQIGNRISTTNSDYEEYIVDLSSLTGNVRLAFVVDTCSYTFYLDDIVVDLAPECPRPTDVAASNIQGTQADISWISPNGSSFEIAYGPRGFNLDSIYDYTVLSSYTTSTTLTGLTGNTYYDVYVKAHCTETSEWSRVYTFKTACGIINLPYSENFNDYTGSTATSNSAPSGYPNHTLPSCWSFNMSQSSSAGTRIFLSSYSSYIVDGKCLFFNGTNSAPGYAVLPKFSSPIDSLFLEFTYRYESASTGHGIIGVMTDPTIDSTFIPLDTLYRTTTLTEVQYPFWDDTLTGYDYYIAIKWHNATSASGYFFSIDNVSVTAPACRPTTNVRATNITTTSADIVWSNITADSYVVAYSTVPGFDPNTCTDTIVANNTIVSLTGLTPYTQYYYSVKTYCGEDNMGWVDVQSFRTLNDCGTLTLVDTIFGNGTSRSYSYPFYATTSTYYSNARTWQIYTQRELEDMGIYAGNINSISWQYDNTTPLTLSFKIYMCEVDRETFSASTDSIPFDQMTMVFNGTQRFEPIDEWSTIVLDSAFNYTGNRNLVVAVERLSDASTYGYFKYTTYTGYYRTIYRYLYSSSSSSYYSGSYTASRVNTMFNVCVVVPSCLRPRNVAISNVQPTQADISYTSEATAFQIAYGPINFSLDSVGTYQIATATDTTHTLTGLVSNTKYDVYVRGICNNTDTSRWSYREWFQTPCLSQAIPYAENFDSYTTDIASYSSAPSSYPEHTMPDCWNFVNMSTSSGNYPQAFLSSDGSYAVSGNCLFFKSSGTTPIYSVLPKFDASIDSLYIEFAYRNESTGSYNGTLSLGVMTDPSNPATFISLETYQQITTITSIEHYFSFDTLQGNNYYIAFCYTGGSSDNYYLSIDDVFVDYAPSCFKPRNLTAGNAGQRSVDLAWTDANNAGNYVVEYKKSIETAWTAITGITDTFATISNLSPATEYAFRVQAICGAGDSSHWSNVAYGATLCGPVELPFGENFTSSTFPANCWERMTGDIFGSPSSYTSGWARVAELSEFQGGYMRVNLYSSSQRYSIVTPEIDLTGVNNGELSFDISRTDYYNHPTPPATVEPDDKFIVAVAIGDTTGTWTWLPANATIWGSDTAADYRMDSLPTTPIHVTIPLAQYAGNIVKIAFYGESTATSDDTDININIDNILISGGSNCPTPALTVTPGSTNAVLSWTSAATEFEVSYKAVADNSWGTAVSVNNATTYTLTGLAPETDYQVRVRAICEEGEASMWAESTFTTLELPCLPPTNVTATNIAYSSVTITWTDPTNNQTEWTVEYGYGENTQTVTATTTSVELTGLYSGMTYTVRVQGRCSAEVTSDWSDAYTFTTATCESVSNLTADNITSSSAVISWTAPAGQTKWELTYGMQGVDEEHGTKVTVTVNPTFTIEGLDYETPYDVYVRAVCGEGVYSSWSQKLSFTTRPVSINTAAADNTNVNIYPNPANTQATITVEGVNGKVEFAVADMNGRMIVTETIDCNGELVKTIDVSNLAKGAYFVHIYNDNFNATRKLIVK